MGTPETPAVARWNGGWAWLTEAPAAAKRTLLAASLGWMLDAFDVMLFSLILGPIMFDLRLDKARAGVLGSAALVGAAAGGIVFGILADRYGRVKALRWSILVYSVFTAACALAHSFGVLLLFRICLGFGMGGEWASGAALVSETWPAAHLGKAMGLMQSSWAVGYALAALTCAALLPHFGWRPVFLVGIAPAFLTLWLRRFVHEPMAERLPGHHAGGRELGRLLRRPLAGIVCALTLMNACTLFAWWGFNLWLPAYLALSPERGGMGFSATSVTVLVVVMQVGMWLGYVLFGVLSDSLGRKRMYVLFLLVAAASLTGYSLVHSALILALLGPVVAFFGTGYFTGFGAITAELFEQPIRASAQGFTYNVGRLASAAAPFTVGVWAQSHGFAAAFRVAASAFAAAAALWFFIPETRGPRTDRLPS